MYSAIRANTKSEVNGNFSRQGSLRKVIPSTEHKDSTIFGKQNEDINKLYKTVHQEYIILAEYKMVQSENIHGVYVIPSKETPLIWFGIIYVRMGIYENAIFRFNLILDENFPDSDRPKCVFLSEIFHPVIHPETNEVNLSDAFPVWNKSDQHLWQVLKYIYWIFNHYPACLGHSINQEASDLYKSNVDAFKEKIRKIVRISQEKIYEEESTIEDKHFIMFEQYNPVVHDKVKTTMLEETKDDNGKTGHSWVLPGTFKPLTRTLSSGSETDL